MAPFPDPTEPYDFEKMRRFLLANGIQPRDVLVDPGTPAFIPFVTCQSNGGTHDDDAYSAGFEMGSLSGNLGMCRALDIHPVGREIHTENLLQADLIAMRYGYKVLVHTAVQTAEGVTYVLFIDQPGVLS